MYYSYMPSPIGKLILAGDQSGLRRIGFEGSEGTFQPGGDWEPSQKPFGETIRQLDAYFEGRLRSFCLPLAAVGTAFQRLVWDRLLEIPFGTTVSYAELAFLIERPKAVRAVGSANGANPLPIVVPCHRVIGSDGRLVGYGGGLHIKEYLLRLERSSE
jgi:methylated-DNA-[protein]-cysteine S-methyltransferase